MNTVMASRSRIAFVAAMLLGGLVGVAPATAATDEPPLCNGIPATIWGTPGNDRGDNAISGTEGDDVIHGLQGRDEIYGLGGNDIICGGSHRDWIWGGDGSDDIFGQGGHDEIRGEIGYDQYHPTPPGHLCAAEAIAAFILDRVKTDAALSAPPIPLARSRPPSSGPR